MQLRKAETKTEASTKMSIGEEFTMSGKKYQLLAIEGSKAKLKCLFCGGKTVYKNVSELPN